MKKLIDKFFIWYEIPNDIYYAFRKFHVIDHTWTYKGITYQMNKRTKNIFVILRIGFFLWLLSALWIVNWFGKAISIGSQPFYIYFSVILLIPILIREMIMVYRAFMHHIVLPKLKQV